MPDDTVFIEHVSNGYVMRRGGYCLGGDKVFSRIEDLFTELLFLFENRRDYLGGELYGKVIVEREKK